MTKVAVEKSDILDLDNFISRDNSNRTSLIKLYSASNSMVYKFVDEQGRILSLFGLVCTSVGIAELWQAPSKYYNKNKFSLYKATLGFIYSIIPTMYDKVIITIAEEEGQMGHKWAVFLGGRPYITMPNFRDGKDHTLYIVDLRKEDK